MDLKTCAVKRQKSCSVLERYVADIGAGSAASDKTRQVLPRSADYSRYLIDDDFIISAICRCGARPAAGTRYAFILSANCSWPGRRHTKSNEVVNHMDPVAHVVACEVR